MNVKEEIKLAIKRENPNYDGKTFDYGCAIYENVLECYEAIEPIIEKAGHSGMSYSIFVNILTRVLKGKPLTPITEEDFENKTEINKETIGDYENEDGSITRQCKRYSSLFRKTTKDGSVSYNDVDRITTIDQYGIGWHSGGTERKCKDLIPPITLPYMPSDKPIKIYTWEFMYDKERGIYFECGSYNACYIDRIEFPNGKVVKVDRLYLDEDNDTPTTYTQEFFEELKNKIEENKVGRELERENE